MKMWMEPVGDGGMEQLVLQTGGGFDGFNGGGNDKETGTDICDDWDGWEGWEGLV